MYLPLMLLFFFSPLEISKRIGGQQDLLSEMLSWEFHALEKNWPSESAQHQLTSVWKILRKLLWRQMHFTVEMNSRATIPVKEPRKRSR